MKDIFNSSIFFSFNFQGTKFETTFFISKFFYEKYPFFCYSFVMNWKRVSKIIFELTFFQTYFLHRKNVPYEKKWNSDYKLRISHVELQKYTKSIHTHYFIIVCDFLMKNIFSKYFFHGDVFESYFKSLILTIFFARKPLPELFSFFFFRITTIENYFNLINRNKKIWSGYLWKNKKYLYSFDNSI